MNTHSLEDRITALAPVPETLDQEWAHTALTGILADSPPVPSPWRKRGRVTAVAVAGVLTLSAGTAVASGSLSPGDTVKNMLLDFSTTPNTTGNDIGTLYTPHLVARFARSNGETFAFWIAATSSGKVCFAYNQGDGTPTQSQLEGGCGGEVLDPTDPNRPVPLERADELGGFFKDEGEPILYGVSPYDGTVAVHVQGTGVDRTLPVRPDSLGYGASLPGAAGARSLALTYLDSAGQTLGTRTVIAPIG